MRVTVTMSDQKSLSDKSNTPPVAVRRSERSFSLLETLVAVSLVALLMVEVSGVHGNSIAFNQYGRKVLQASYLAKRIMSQVEYQASIRAPFKDIKVPVKDVVFEDFPDFTYSLSIDPLPNALDLMFKIFSGGMLGGGEKEDGEDQDSGMAAMLTQMKGVIEQSVGEEPIWIAKVEISWPEGARRNSTTVAMIVTDTKKLEDSVAAVMDASPAQGAGGTPPTPTTIPQGGIQPGGVP